MGFNEQARAFGGLKIELYCMRSGAAGFFDEARCGIDRTASSDGDEQVALRERLIDAAPDGAHL